MKRAFLASLVIGALAAAAILLLHQFGFLARPELALANALDLPPNESFPAANYLLVAALALGAAWGTLAINGAFRRIALLIFLLAEIVGAAWVLALADVFFQPLPALLVVPLAALLALAWSATRANRERRVGERLFRGRLQQSAIDRLTTSTMHRLVTGQARSASLVFCEIGNQAELIDEMDPAASIELTREWIELTTGHFLSAGGYVQSADGEGVRAFFGLPNESENHAREAARATLSFREAFLAAAREKPQSLGKISFRLGINSGTVLATVRDGAAGLEMLVAGEPVELARRLARANQIYGSQILLGPEAFNLAGKSILARPLDFLRTGVEQDPLEIYELLSLGEKASAEELARRDRFWTALVHFRARRWNEAFAEFAHARDGNGEHDAPLQWYLRRLEPLCLQMTIEPAPASQPLLPL